MLAKLKWLCARYSKRAIPQKRAPSCARPNMRATKLCAVFPGLYEHLRTFGMREKKSTRFGSCAWPFSKFALPRAHFGLFWTRKSGQPPTLVISFSAHNCAMDLGVFPTKLAGLRDAPPEIPSSKLLFSVENCACKVRTVKK